MVKYLSALARAPRSLILSVALAAVAFFAIGGAGGDTPTVDAADSKYLMCNWTVQYRTQTVYIDPAISNVGVSRSQVHGAFNSWNKLFQKYHGFPIFAETSSRASADIVIDAKGSQSTWVDTVCNRSYRTQGRSHSTVYVGVNDKWRNASMLAHELGHALGLSDHGVSAQHASGHIGFQRCSNYYGIMSYCSSAQTWFLDINQRGIYVDGNLVRDYWR